MLIAFGRSALICVGDDLDACRSVDDDGRHTSRSFYSPAHETAERS